MPMVSAAAMPPPGPPTATPSTMVRVPSTSTDTAGDSDGPSLGAVEGSGATDEGAVGVDSGAEPPVVPQAAKTKARIDMASRDRMEVRIR